MAYASGKHSIAICDRCGFRYKYTQLQKEWTGFRVCSECFEPNHPQLEPVRHLADPEALRHPRPDISPNVVAGIVTATSYKGDGSALTGVGGEFDITSCLFI